MKTPFDWRSSRLTARTPITPDYRNTQNVRRFFKAACGDHFRFDRPFMAWMKAASGKTLGDAAAEWLRREKKKKKKKNRTGNGQ